MTKATPSALESKNTTASKKQVQIVARYFLKAALAIVYVMINGGGKRYMVTIHTNGTSSCVLAESGETCEGCHYGHVCYHKKAAKGAEEKYQAQVAGVERCDCSPHALHSKADHAMMESVGAAPSVLTRVPVVIVQEDVQGMSKECPQNATIVSRGCPVSTHVVTLRYENGFDWWRCTCRNCSVFGKICEHIAAAKKSENPEQYRVAGDEEQFSEAVAARWVDEELSSEPLTREQYVALFDPNYEACYA